MSENVLCVCMAPDLSSGALAVPLSGGGPQQSPLKRSVSLTPPMSGPSSQPLGHVWLSQEDLRTTRGPAPDHAPLSPQSSIASSGSGGSEHLEDAGLGGGLHRSSFHEDGSGMRGKRRRHACWRDGGVDVLSLKNTNFILKKKQQQQVVIF